MLNHILIKMMPFLLLLLLQAGMGFATSSDTLYKYNISGTVYYTSKNDVDKVMPDMHIDLMEGDSTNFDDNLGHAVTDGQGHFEGLVGEEDEKEETEPYLRIPNNDCTSLWKPKGTTKVWLPSTPEHQNLSIYLGYKDKRMAILHREGHEDLPLKMQYCQL